MSTLADGGSDLSYEGEQGGFFSLDSFRAKIGELQSALILLDSSYRAGLAVYEITPTSELSQLLSDYQEKYSDIASLAETVNSAASAVNALGGRAGIISIPQTLGFAPLAPIVLSAAALTAIAGIAAWVSYARGYANAMQAAITTVRQNVTNPDEVSAVETQLVKLEQAQTAMDVPFFSSIVDNVSGTIKFGAVVVVAYLAWRAYKGLDT